MKTYARIDGGKVVEIIAPLSNDEGAEVPIEARFHPDIVVSLVDVTDVPEVSEGWTYDGNTVTPPTIPAGEQRAATIREIEAVRDAKLAAGVEWNGYLWQTDALFQAQLTGIVGAYTAGILPASAQMGIRTKDNQTVQLDGAQIKTLAGTVLAYVQGVFAESWAAKDAL
jgi:hypothetical protein